MRSSRRAWTKKEVAIIRRLYADKPTRELAGLLGRSARSIYAQAYLLGLNKNEKYIRTCRLQPGHAKGRATQFKQGHLPHNKGKKGWQAGGDSVKSQFKKGQNPHNWAPVGSTRISKGGIIQRKISDTGYPPRDWRSEHSILWEQHHGPIPKQHIIVFRNGNVNDIRIENLEMISRAENMRRNTIHNLPEALADTCRAIGVLNRRIRERSSHEK
ncbi:MAG: HNH endonuclease signature motif containing protein [Desulfobacteraceae bacterium]|nr:HNH endonuclease signature motif containing protein [Desulfobacteraceae bacterium]